MLLADFVRLIEEVTGHAAHLTPTPMSDADIAYTYADISKARRLLGYTPRVAVAEGVGRFWGWYRQAVLAQSVADLSSVWTIDQAQRRA